MFNTISLFALVVLLLGQLTNAQAELGSKATTDSKKLAQLHAFDANGDYEPAILDIIEKVKLAQLDSALDATNAHLEKFPKSQVGHLLKADILNALTGELSEVGASSTIPPEQLHGLKHQLINRWRHATQEEHIAHENLPGSLLDMGENEYVVVADMPKGRLYLYKNLQGTPTLVRDYYMTVGSAGYGKQIEGDNKTPIGVYNINRYIEGKALPDLYGKGAFPVNYPNRYDRYLNRTGYGIWLHGTPSDTYARSPWASEGCFVLSNDDLIDISQYVSAEKRTPVILSDSIEWLSLDELQQRRHELIGVIEQWRKDWESLDTQAYVAHYQATNFNLGKGDYKTWAKRKRDINEAKNFVQVDLDIKSLFVYPGEKDMFIVRYAQRYLSDNFSGESSKEQLWKRDQSGRWRIIYEG